MACSWQPNLVSFGLSTIAADSVMAFDSWQTRSGPPLLCQLRESNWTKRRRKVWRYLLPSLSSLWRNLVAWHPYCDQIVGNYFLSVSFYMLSCRGLFRSSLPQGFGPWVSFRSLVESFVLVSKMEQYWKQLGNNSSLHWFYLTSCTSLEWQIRDTLYLFWGCVIEVVGMCRQLRLFKSGLATAVGHGSKHFSSKTDTGSGWSSTSTSLPWMKPLTHFSY